MTFSIITLGCKVNLYESEMMKEKLEKAGFLFQEENSDITIINTCTVTNMADKKSQKMVRHIKKSNPNTILVVAGCSSENKQKEYESMDIDILIGNQNKSKIVFYLNQYKEEKKKKIQFANTRNIPFESMEIEKFTSHTRAFLKIQDGCNNFCSYCIIPYVRGVLRSKPMKDVLKEANSFVNHGHKEIVLTGINTGAYGYGMNYDLTDLIHELSKIKKLKRIRISSIEITELNDKFLNELRKNSKICDHLHIPLQAGSDDILKKMNRKYNLKEFENKLKEIRNIRPFINITTDIIVGHPFETDELFQQTLNTVKKFKFSKVHAFPYSKRDGTASAKMIEQVKEEIKKERNRELISLSNTLELEYAKQFLNQTMDVLIEETKDQFYVGHTSNYLKVKIKNESEQNQMESVLLQKLDGVEIIGEKHTTVNL